MSKLLPYQVIQALEADNSRLNKETIISQQVTDQNKEFFDGVRLALDKLVTFGVKKVPTHGGPDGQGLPWAAFKQLADSLHLRQLTGHAARDAIELALSASKKDEWNDWYRRILIKDLRCGVSEKTVNKCLKGSTISPVPVFSVMLAHDGADHENKITGKKILQPKLDGVRVITVVNMENRTVIQYTRNGNILTNFSHITDAIEKNIDLIGRSVVLDGEMISTSFQALMTQVHRKDNVQANDASLMLFDILPLNEFNKGRSVLNQKHRSELLKSFEPVFKEIGNISVISSKEVDLDTFVGELEFKEYNEEMIEKGFEGIMIKSPDAKYECKRTTSWLKIKPFITVDLKVVALEEGTGKNEGKLGALICEGDDNGKFISVNVGSGLTDELREDIWNNQKDTIGQIVEIKADCITKNQDSESVYSLRFPRFLKFRGFIAGDKI